MKFIKKNSVFVGAFWSANSGVKDKFGFLCQVLSDDILKEFQYRGFLDANVKITTSNREGEQGLLIEIEEGEQFKFLGYEVDKDTPEWLASHLNTLLKRDPSGITGAIKKSLPISFQWILEKTFL